jgi:hypothetical protein
MAKVKIVGNDVAYNCTCANWLDHWIINSGQSVTWCCEKDCTGTNLVGAHVKLLGKQENEHITYIIPICKRHHNLNDVIEIDDIYRLVEVSKGTPCLV